MLTDGGGHNSSLIMDNRAPKGAHHHTQEGGGGIFTYRICNEYAQCNYLLLSINIVSSRNKSFNCINISLMSCNMKWCRLRLL